MNKQQKKIIYIKEKQSLYFPSGNKMTLKGVGLRVFDALASSMDKGITKNDLVFSVWGNRDIQLHGKALNQQIYLLRKATIELGEEIFISSSRNGYKLKNVVSVTERKQKLYNTAKFIFYSIILLNLSIITYYIMN